MSLRHSAVRKVRVTGADCSWVTEINKGTLSSHLSRLEEAGYVEVEKTYRGKIPQTLLHLTDAGRKAFEEYRRKLKGAI